MNPIYEAKQNGQSVQILADNNGVTIKKNGITDWPKGREHQSAKCERFSIDKKEGYYRLEVFSFGTVKVMYLSEEEYKEVIMSAASLY